jgi:hypothetical protein
MFHNPHIDPLRTLASAYVTNRILAESPELQGLQQLQITEIAVYYSVVH